MALTSLSWPEKVCLHVPSLMSHSLDVKSHAPEMKKLKSGDTPRDMQSPWCPAYTVFWVPVSMSHSMLEWHEPQTVTIYVLKVDMDEQRGSPAVFLPSAIAWAGDDLRVADETTAGQVT